ncbi:MAG TPA: SDR family oxidoreductase [Chitinophagaceae bacterium]|nr:SDR family oxidoreductase [Chitinophagaceae bacterium]
MPDFFQDKVVVVTGGTDGIGRALVDSLLDRGAVVATCARNHDKLYQLQTSRPSAQLYTMVADVSSENECRRFIEMTIKMFGGIDILINNAGISMRALLQDAPTNVIRQVMEVNFFGTVYCTKYALDSIRARKGTIVGVSSVAGFRGLPGRTGYNASKFAMQGFLESLRTELLGTGVHVMWVCPGFTASNIRQAALTASGTAQGYSTLHEGNLMTAEECAAITLRAIRKRRRTLVYTIADKRTIWINKLLPGLADRLVHRFFFKKGELVK